MGANPDSRHPQAREIGRAGAGKAAEGGQYRSDHPDSPMRGSGLEAPCLKPGSVAPLRCVVQFEARNIGPKALREDFLSRCAVGALWVFISEASRPKISCKRGEGDDKGPMPPVGQLCLFGLALAAFTGKVFTNATASSSHALSASFVGTGGSI